MGGSSKIQTFISRDLSSIEIEVYSNGKGAGILLTNLYNTQRVLATPTLIGT